MVSACPLHVQSCWWRLHLSTHRFLNVAASFSLVKKNTKMDNHGQLEINMIAPGWTEFHDLHDLSCLACSCQSYICSLAAPSSLAGSSISDTKEKKGKQTSKCLLICSLEWRRASIGIKHNSFLLGTPVPEWNLQGTDNTYSQQRLFSGWNGK